MGKLPISLFIGRFQPFHKGHLAALRYIAKRSGKVIVAIGSAQEKATATNPFSATERKRMIAAQLREAGLGRKCGLFALTDVNSDGRWVAHVDSRLPKYDVCFSNNALVLKLMRKAGKKVARVPFFKKERFNATKIRQMMRKGEEWKSRVPKAVASSLAKMNAEERVGRL